MAMCEFRRFYPPRCRKRATVAVEYIYQSGYPDPSRITLRCPDHHGKADFKGITIVSVTAVKATSPASPRSK